MKKITFAIIGLIFIYFLNLAIFKNNVSAQKQERNLTGIIYGVFETQNDSIIAKKMLKAGFKQMNLSQLNRAGLKSKTKTDFKYFIIPLQNIKLEVDDKKTKSIWNGSFSMPYTSVSFEQWIIKPAVGDIVLTEFLNFKKTGNNYYIYIFFPNEDVEKSMNITDNNIYAHAGCKNHCIKWPDCAINLAAGVSWCWYELKYSPSINDPKRFCNGKAKSYLNGDGYNCSYFLGLRQCR